MPDGQPTVADVFKENGYHTAYFGKWHCDGFKERNGRAAMHTVPRARRGGFDIWLGYDNNNSPWDSWLHGHDRSGAEVPHYRLPSFETDALTDLFIRHIREQAQRSKSGGRDSPFSPALSVQTPHIRTSHLSKWMGRHTPGRPDICARTCRR